MVIKKMNEVAGFSEESLRKIAEQKVNFRRSVKIHWAVYLLVNTFLIILNLLIIGPDLIINVPVINITLVFGALWALYPLLGWFIGVIMHTVAYSMYAKGVFPFAKRGVIFHLTAFLTVMLLLGVINILTMPGFYWVIFPAIFWGMGLIIHIVVYNIYLSGKVSDTGEGKSKKEKAIEKEMQKMKNKINN